MYIKAGASDPAGSKSTDAMSQPQPDSTPEEDEAEHERRRKERKERAVREREEKVRAERSKLEAEIDRSKLGLTKEEGEADFRCASWSCLCQSLPGATHRCCAVQLYRTMLTDAIRDPQVCWPCWDGQIADGSFPDVARCRSLGTLYCLSSRETPGTSTRRSRATSSCISSIRTSMLCARST